MGCPYLYLIRIDTPEEIGFPLIANAGAVVTVMDRQLVIGGVAQVPRCLGTIDIHIPAMLSWLERDTCVPSRGR